MIISVKTLDVYDFYPSIFKQLLMKVLDYAYQIGQYCFTTNANLNQMC